MFLKADNQLSVSLIEREMEDEPPPSWSGRGPSLLKGKHTRIPQTSTFIHKSSSIKLHYSPTEIFRKKFYPEIKNHEWNDWQWQLRNCIKTPEQLSHFLNLSHEEQVVLTRMTSELPVRITPYYMSLLDAERPDQPLRRSVVPTINELYKSTLEDNDPLGEEHQSALLGLVHRYPDRVLLLVNDFCATYCRYCTRSRLVGKDTIQPGKPRLEEAIEYIRNTPSVRDVLLSGGDPLLLSDERLDWLLGQLRKIEHVEIIRIGTKVPAVLPQRVTPKLVKILKKYHPLWMSLHFTHPDECTPETSKACQRLANAGIPLGSQSVLLKGINDSVETMKALVHQLLRIRVRPYYLYQCDLVSGTSHFRTSIDKGQEIIRGLRGFTSGYAVPNFVIDAPGGGGKIPVMPNYMNDQDKSDLVLTNFEGKVIHYPETTSPKLELLSGSSL